MTIGIGFKCRDGLVIATDTKYTKGDFKTQGPKLFPLFGHTERSDIAVVVAGAGHVPYMKMGVSKIDAAISALRSPSLEDVRSTIEDVLASFFKTHIYPRRDQSECGFELILGVWTESDGYSLVTTDDTAVNVFSRYGTDACCIGLGQHVAEHALGLVFDHSLNVEHGKFLAAFCIKSAKDYSDSYGGKTHIYTLNEDGSGFRVHRVSPSEVTSAEEYATDIYDGAKRFLKLLDVRGLADDSAVGSLSELIRNTVVEFRDKQRARNERLRRARERHLTLLSLPHERSS